MMVAVRNKYSLKSKSRSKFQLSLRSDQNLTAQMTGAKLKDKSSAVIRDGLRTGIA